MIRAHARSVLAVLSVTTGLSCVLPDLEIVTEDEKITNKQPVRFARPMVLTDRANEACIRITQDDPDVGCPQAAADPSDALPPFLDPRRVVDGVLQYDFCSCGMGERDQNALGKFTLYVEDRDEETRTRVPKDKIFAALLLDLDPKSELPHEAVAYPGYLDSKVPLKLAENPEYEPLLRPDPHLRQLTLGDESEVIDLCNRSGRGPLPEGFHTLRIIVTDRPWFTFIDDYGQKLTQTGVPDLAVGATFDFVTYTFHCDSERPDVMGTGYDEGHCNTQCLSADEESL
jgi:hypothetical protein